MQQYLLRHFQSPSHTGFIEYIHKIKIVLPYINLFIYLFIYIYKFNFSKLNFNRACFNVVTN